MFLIIKSVMRSVGIALAALCDLSTSKWVVLVGNSMHPTLKDGQRVRVSRRAYRDRSPARWDVVLFEHPQRDGFWEIKRVVGLPGESISLDAGGLFVDGVRMKEPSVPGTQPHLVRKWQLSRDEYVLLGDNRRRSTDSRSFGPVHRSRIVGLVIRGQD